MYEIKVNLTKLKQILNRGELIEKVMEGDSYDLELEGIDCPTEELLEIVLNASGSDLYFNSKKGIFTFPFVGIDSKAEEYFYQEFLEFTQPNTDIKTIIEKISNLIDLERVDVDTFSCYLDSTYFSKEAKEIIYEYYTEALKKVKLPLNTVGLEELWQEYRNVLEFLGDFSEFKTDELSFTPKCIEEIQEQFPDLNFWVTNSENTLVVKYF